MDDLLTKQNISVETDLDRVVLSIQKLQFLLPYAQAFKISHGIASAGRLVMQQIKEPRKNWRDWMKLEGEDSLHVTEISPEKRGTMTTKFDWRVELDGEMIYLWLGNNRVGFHFETGFKVAQWLRLGAAQAKRWAGDTSKSFHVTGHLTDAENNYKLGLE